MSELLTAALSYARRGFHVIPVHTPVCDGCSCRKQRDCTAKGKHPRTANGVNDASSDPAQIERWWDLWPEANIGIVTGRDSGVIVIDVDNKHGKTGGENLKKLAAEHGGIPATLTARTGNGQHFFFEYPKADIKNSISKLVDGVDVKAERGYVVAAPSLHANGSRYEWLDETQGIAELPDWLLTDITKRKDNTKLQNPTPNPLEDAPTVQEGERNDTLFKLGSALRGKHGKEYPELLPILNEYNASKCVPPLDASEVAKIAQSICDLYPAEMATGKSAARLEQNPLYWFPFNTRDWLADMKIAVMSDAQTGWYIRLLIYAWSNGGFLPADSASLQMTMRYAHLSGEHKLAAVEKLTAFQVQKGTAQPATEQVEASSTRTSTEVLEQLQTSTSAIN